MSATRPDEPFTMTITPLTTKVKLADGSQIAVCAVATKVPHIIYKNMYHIILMDEATVKARSTIKNYNEFYALKELGTMTIKDFAEKGKNYGYVEVQRMDTFKPNNRYIGTALHEYAFRFSVEKGRGGRVELATTESSHVFHYACGFRAGSSNGYSFQLNEPANNLMAELIASKKRVDTTHTMMLSGIHMALPEEAIKEKLLHYPPVQSQTITAVVAKPTVTNIPMNNDEKLEKKESIPPVTVVSPPSFFSSSSSPAPKNDAIPSSSLLKTLDWRVMSTAVNSCKEMANEYLKKYPESAINWGALFGSYAHQCQEQAKELIAICDLYENNKKMDPKILYYFIIKGLIELIYNKVPENDELFIMLSKQNRPGVVSTMESRWGDRSTYYTLQDLKTCLDAVIGHPYGKLGEPDHGWSLSMTLLPSAHLLKYNDIPKLLVNLKTILAITPAEEENIAQMRAGKAYPADSPSRDK